MLDTATWNLAWPLAAVVTACGPSPGTQSDTSTDTSTETSGQTSSTDTGTGTSAESSNTNPVTTDGDCGYCEYDWSCEDGVCVPPYSDDDGTCGGTGCGCELNDCDPLELCGEIDCEPVPAPSDCADALSLTGTIPLPMGTETDVLSLTFVDADGDPAQDLAIAHLGGVQVVLGPGVNPPIEIAMAATADPSSIVAGDFDNDGNDDLVVSNDDMGGNLDILLGDGNGSFVIGPGLQGEWVGELVGGNFNGDGNLDVVGIQNGQIELFVGDGTGGFSPQAVANAGNPIREIAVGELNGDAFSDVLVTGDRFPLALLLGHDAGLSWVANTFEDVYGSTGQGLVAADFDLDGNQDVVVTRRINSWSLAVAWQGTASEAFAAGEPLGLAADLRVAAQGDIDGDGTPDVVMAGPFVVGVLFGSGGGGELFDCFAQVDGPLAEMLAVGDMDGDGRDDVALSNGASLTVVTEP